MLTAALIVHVLLHEVPLAIGAILVVCRICKRKGCDKPH